MKLDKTAGILALLALLLLIAGCAQKATERPQAAEIAVECGNNVIEEGENCLTCPRDAACILGETCVEGACKKLTDVKLCGNGIDDTDERLGIFETPENCCRDVGCQNDLLECVNNQCITKKCNDNTPYEQCASDKPLFCQAGKLVDNCSKCGCTQSYGCKEDGSCVKLITNNPPEVEAGETIEAEIAERVKFDGSVTDKTPNVTYQWTQLSGPLADLHDADKLRPYFVPRYPGTYTFELKANDGEFVSADTLKVEVGMPTKDAVFFMGENELIYVDKTRRLHILPFVIKNKLASYKLPSTEEDLYFELEGIKLYYKYTEYEVKDRPYLLTIRADAPNGKIVGEVELRDRTIKPIVVRDAAYKILENYAVLIDDDQEIFYVIMYETEFELAADISLFFKGTDFRDKGDIFPSVGFEAYVPKEDSFVDYGNPATAKNTYVAIFMVANTKQGVTRIRALIDTATNKPYGVNPANLTYKGPAEYYRAKGVKLFYTNTAEEAYTLYKESISIVDDYLLVKVPPYEEEELFS